MSGKRKNAAAVALATLAATSLLTVSARAYITIGDFENGNNEGWFDWTLSSGGSDNNGNPGATPANDLPAPVYSFSSEGATLGTSALAATVAPTGRNNGFYQGLSIKTDFQTDSEGNSEMADTVDNKMLAMDVTYNAAEWSGSTYNNLTLTVNFDNGQTGANEINGFLTLANSANPINTQGGQTGGYPTYDTANNSPTSGFPGGWDPTTFPGVTTRTLYWDYADYVPASYSLGGTTTTNSGNLTMAQLIGPTPEYVEFELTSSSTKQGTFHFDNFRLTQTAPVNATWTNSAGPNTGGTYSWGSLLNWVAGSGAPSSSGNVALPSNPGDVVNFTDLNIAAHTTVTLNENEEFQISVGTMNFNSGNGYTIAQGTGGTLTLNGTTTVFNYSQEFDATTQTVTPGIAQINDLTGNQTISAPVSLATSVNIAVGQASNAFTISGNISGTGGVTLAGDTTALSAGTVVFSGANTYGGGTTVSSGTLLIAANGALPVNNAVSIGSGTLKLATSTGLAQIASLAITGNGTLDVNNNHVIINYGSGTDPISSIAALLKTGFNGGTWNGAGGIVSSAAAVTPGYGLGYADFADAGNPASLSSGTIEIKYTLLGDANLDGTVNGIDFGILAANFNKGVTGWDKGDFNYDNVVSGIDFGELAANFNKGASGADLGPGALSDPALVAFAQANGLMADVPEPACASLLLLSGASILARRRRTQ